MRLEIVYLYLNLLCVSVQYQLDMSTMSTKTNASDWLKDTLYSILVQCESDMTIPEVIQSFVLNKCQR